MKFRIIALPTFKKALKKLTKKYPSLKQEFSQLIVLLETNPTSGISLGKNCYKIRISIASKAKGKSGGARIISYVVIKKSIVYLLTIYDKQSKDSISDEEIDFLINLIDD